MKINIHNIILEKNKIWGGYYIKIIPHYVLSILLNFSSKIQAKDKTETKFTIHCPVKGENILIITEINSCFGN